MTAQVGDGGEGLIHGHHCVSLHAAFVEYEQIRHLYIIATLTKRPPQKQSSFPS
jgi:hypothetical protein